MENTNKLNSGSVETLKPGDCLLVGARKLETKIELEFAEKIQTSSNRPLSAIQLLNASDPRFSSGARRCWQSVEIDNASEIFGVNFGDDGDWYASERGEMMDLNILNPNHKNELFFRLWINETTEPTEWQAENQERAAKRAGKNGDFITHNGSYIYSNTSLVMITEDEKPPKHIYLAADTQTIGVQANKGAKADEVVMETINLEDDNNLEY